MRVKKIVVLILFSFIVAISGVGGYLYVKYGQYWLNPILKSEIATSILGKIEKDRYKIIWANRYSDISNIALVNKLTDTKFAISKSTLLEEPLKVPDIEIEDFLKTLQETPENLGLKKIKITMKVLEKGSIISETGLKIPYAKVDCILNGHRQLLFCTTFTYKEKEINLYNNISLSAFCEKDKYDEQEIKNLINRILSQKMDVSSAKNYNKKVNRLIKKLQKKDSDPETRKEVLYSSILRGGDKAVEASLLALKDEDVNIRETAAFALWEIGDKKAVFPLIDALNDESRKVRLYATLALGRIGEKKAVEPLMRVLEKDEDEMVRATAAMVLGELGDRKAIKSLISALEDKSAVVRQDAAFVLRRIGDKSAIPKLTSLLLKDEDETVRREAKKAIEEIRTRTDK